MLFRYVYCNSPENLFVLKVKTTYRVVLMENGKPPCRRLNRFSVFIIQLSCYRQKAKRGSPVGNSYPRLFDEKLHLSHTNDFGIDRHLEVLLSRQSKFSSRKVTSLAILTPVVGEGSSSGRTQPRITQNRKL